MKIGPKIPEPAGLGSVNRTEPGAAAHGAGKTSPAGRFAEALRPAGAEGAAAPGVPAGAIADVAARYGAGELTRAEAARQVAEVAVRGWPAGLTDDTARMRAVEQLSEALAEDPSFSALLDAAAGRSG